MTPLFAELTAEGWVLIVGAIFLGIGQITSMILAYYREKARIERDKVTATKVEAVAVAAKEVKVEAEAVKVALADTSTQTTNKLDHIIELTNSTLTAAQAALTASNERVEALEKLAGIAPGASVPASGGAK